MKNTPKRSQLQSLDRDHITSTQTYRDTVAPHELITPKTRLIDPDAQPESPP